MLLADSFRFQKPINANPETVRCIIMIDNLYILGAGASADAGAPLMANFLDTVEDLINSNKFENPNGIKDLFDSINSLNSILAKSKIDLNNIESVLGLLEMSELLEQPINYKGQTDFKSLKSSYIRMISETIEQSMKYEIQHATSISPTGTYKNFVEAIANKKDSSAIISFNYDLGVDVALHNKGIKYNYYLNDSDNLFPLLKLHGSLNWFQDKSSNIIPHTIFNFFHKMRYQNDPSDSKRQGTLTFVEYIKTHFPNDYDNHNPFIIPPTWNKTMYHNSISSVWKKASQCLSEAKNIYVIGYSLPDTDTFFKFLFSLGTNSTTRIRRFWVMNPDPSSQQRYHNLLGPQVLERFKFIPYPFQSAVLDKNNWA